MLLAAAADGDARRALNLLEIAADLAEDGSEVGHRVVLQKSLLTGRRGVSTRAAKLLRSDFRTAQIRPRLRPGRGAVLVRADARRRLRSAYLARRVVRMASEDIGNADPRALRLAPGRWEVQERLGSPEGELAIAQAIVYLACAPRATPCTWVSKSHAATPASTARWRCRCTCATRRQADEGTGLRR